VPHLPRDAESNDARVAHLVEAIAHLARHALELGPDGPDARQSLASLAVDHFFRQLCTESIDAAMDRWPVRGDAWPPSRPAAPRPAPPDRPASE
jgi:hypothetical protein